MRFVIPNVYDSRKYKSTEVLEDIVLGKSNLNPDKLPKEIPLNYYYTDKDGNEVESIRGSGEYKSNGISNQNVSGAIGFEDMKGLLTEIDKDSNPSEITIWYRVLYRVILVGNP